MNFPEQDLRKSVASWDDILATNRPIPYAELPGRDCIGSLDFASIRDFAAVGLLFKVREDYVFLTHISVRAEFLRKTPMKPPIYDWEKEGLLTIVDEPTIGIHHIVNWFVEMREKYGVNTVVADNFRLELVRNALQEKGFEVVHLRNPRAIHSLLAPRVESLFANQNIIFGDNPLMRWYCQNVVVSIKKDGSITKNF